MRKAQKPSRGLPLNMFLKVMFSGMLVACPVYTFAVTGNVDSVQKVAQQKLQITGKVVDQEGEPMPGVNILERGTTNGTITDIDGKFTLDVARGSILQVSYIGFVTVEVEAKNGLNIILKEDSQSLSEVVVVGYGTQQKKDITGSVAVVDTKELLKTTGSSATQQLQGKASGVYIGQSGSPGSPAMVRIRGINTVNDNGPLYVIDGVSTRNQDLSSLNPNDIESMQVLKDASSAAIYGAQAANGVILITTKKGTKSGQPKFSYSGYVGFQATGKRYDVLNSMDRLNLEWKAKANNLELNGVEGKYPSHVQFGTGPTPTIPNYMTEKGADGRQDIVPGPFDAKFSDTNWWDEIDRKALIQNHQISVAGGNEKGQYNFSANYYHQDGTVIDSYYNRYTIRANTSYNIRNWFRVGENLQYSFTKDNGLSPNGAEDSPYSWTYRACPYVPVYTESGAFGGSILSGTGNFRNPVSIQKRNKDNYYTHNRIFGNMWAEIDPIKNVTYRTNFGLDYTNNYSYRMAKKDPEFSESMGQNNFEEVSGFNYRWVWTNTIQYNATFNDVHKLTVLLGSEAIRDGLGRSMTGRRYNYLYEDNKNTWVLNMGENNGQRITESTFNGEFALFGLFSRVDYSFADKYLFTGIIRRDGVSRFAKTHRYGTFPSVSLGWRISQESFMNGTKGWLDDLKLRFGYGETGNSEVPRITNYAFEYGTNPRRTDYDLTGANTSTAVGYNLDKYGNEDTKWEATKMFNIGVDVSMFNGKLGVNLELYTKKTSDMLISAQYSAMAGETVRPYINFGDMKNTGFDFNIDYRDKKGDWSWDIALNLSHYKNEVVKISESDDASMWGSGSRISGYVTRTTKGHAISEFYGYKVNGFYENPQEVLALLPLGKTSGDIGNVDKAKAWVGKYKFADINGDGRLTSADRTFIGSPHPDLIAGLNTTIGYKNFDFTMFWYSTIGNDLFNNTKYFTDFWLFEGNRSTRIRDNSWTAGADNSKATLPVLDYGDTYSGTNSNSYYVEDASFLRLKNVVLGYTFPKKWLQKASIQNLRIYLQAENLLTFTGYSGLDPEFTNASVGGGNGSDLRRGLDMGGWPTTKRFLFGVNFEF
ncbi:SusC/RagA family TonB-linked outer membrane protein [Phocaeicola oris]|uniref:SusC/RagA family TonB-linked outer membrane protein n=1 Tax=Phocaeicola oris TaxID=2896850 RepID=UPI00234E4AF2|nr:TonB-dependent receptor [Phocaeicola oris]MCE2616544.1 TonB-dependent receptor [Phocaeicola oris]